MDGNGFVAFADNLLSNNADEATRRSIVSRYYYGVFHLAKDAAGIQRQSASEHQEVINHYASRNTKLSNNLNSLRRARTKADYRLNANFSFTDLKGSRRTARNILKSLNE